MGSTRVRPRSVRRDSTRRGVSVRRSTRPYCWSRRSVWVRTLREMPPMRPASSPCLRGCRLSPKSTSTAHLSEMISTARRVGQSARKVGPAAFCMKSKVPGGNRRLRNVFRDQRNSTRCGGVTMPRVVVFDEFGRPDVMHAVEEPVVEPAAGEVRVRIEAFAVNPLDQMMRSGTSPAIVPLPHARLGVEGTGVIDALGPGVTGLEAGDPVILTAIPDATARGSYAEYTTVPASRITARPAGLGITEAAAVWVAYSTAYGALVEKAKIRPGDHVLITAASGGVGRAAIQIANQIGAVPIA